MGAIKEFIEEYQQTQKLIHKTIRYLPSTESLDLDDNKFMQVINNLLSNAIKFTPDGGERTVVLEEKETTVLIQVKDTGIGIPGLFHATLFDKFTRARRAGLKGEPSVGLGMSIIKPLWNGTKAIFGFRARKIKALLFILRFRSVNDNTYLYKQLSIYWLKIKYL